MDKEHPGKKRVAEIMDRMTRNNQIMKVAFTTENTWYKAKAHETLATPPWYLRSNTNE